APAAQAMRWTRGVGDPAQRGGGGGGRGGGGRGGGMMQPEVREKTVTVIMKMTKASVDGKESITFKHAPINKDQRDEDIARTSIPWADKDDLVEKLKTTLTEMKRPGTVEERKQVYKDANGNFVIKSIREGNTKNMEISITNEAGKSTDFTLSQQQVEVFYNQLRNMK
ncbi:MAG: hypothetical protein FWH21_08805, partial [Kiritimatiellaeota bacterium]|nr:hypothetical protein [Kiritimatiellota bacterium]